MWLFEFFRTRSWKLQRSIQTCLEKYAKLNNIVAIVSIAASLATIFTVHFLSRQVEFQLQQVKLQREQMELENRPYLYVDVDPVAFEALQRRTDGSEYYDLYLGAHLTYKNVGKTPACNIKTELHMYNDAVKTDDAKRLDDWFVNTLGARPKVTAVFPQQTVV